MLSALAAAIYTILRSLVPDPSAEITYSQLVSRLGPMDPPNENLQPRDRRLDAALGDLVHACRGAGLPAISALVVRDDEGSPGAGYYPVAHPGALSRDTAAKMIAWGNEIQAVRATEYPVQPQRN